ncbi:YaaA family protein [Microbacterium sp. RG1]|uniref:YaaA family protein n=1 Tax=Microbacterium sp. RG1 TaxID=2489212 RepID=UPI0010CA5122|nr:peroxide stress protein YaaA [Microbacterium sp. RG1]QCQ15506.1 peroxide stress protein YaaA [Microbacterium sp. RG1]
MLVLLPPSETKRAGGAGAPWSSAALRLPQLTPQREAVVSALVELSRDEDAAAKVLKLSVRQRGEVAVNAALRSSPTMPAVDRYTGVLFDALDASSLDARARRWLGEHVLIHSAPFGPVGALDPIPAYRLGAGASLPGLAPLRRHWAEAATSALGQNGAHFILDLRSEAYVALGPVPTESASAYVRVVTTGADGEVRALNHFNKHAKGALVRRLAEERPRIASRGAFLRWTKGAGIAVADAENGELRLTV